MFDNYKHSYNKIFFKKHLNGIVAPSREFIDRINYIFVFNSFSFIFAYISSFNQ